MFRLNKKQETDIRNPKFAGAPKKDGPRVNRDINETEVRLIAADGDNVGVVDIRRALDMAKEAGLDLVEVSPHVSPPVCKILDFGKFKFEAQKKASAARKKQKTVEVKEIKMRPNTDVHDFHVKMKKVHEFIAKGDKVKITIRFRGREMAHQELGMDVLKRVEEEMQEEAKIESRPKTEGRQMMMMMGPK